MTSKTLPICLVSIRSNSLPLIGNFFTDRSQGIGMSEVIVPADSSFVGSSVAEARFRDRTGLDHNWAAPWPVRPTRWSLWRNIADRRTQGFNLPHSV